MSPAFERAFGHVIGVEGGFSNVAADSGGRTNFGITEQVARSNGYSGDMRSLPIATAKQIYKKQYWDTLRLDDVAVLSESIASELFDTGVNAGIGTAGKFLQRAINALNSENLAVDGGVGGGTLAALKSFLVRRGKQGEIVMLRALNSLQGAYYIELTERRPKDRAFAYGWLNNRVAI